MKNIFKRPAMLFLIPLISIIFSSCGFINSFKPSEEKEESSVEITSLTLSKQTASVSVGEMVYIMVNVKPQNKQKELKLEWKYDDKIIEADTSTPWGITIKGLAEGQTNLLCSYDGYVSSCIVTVSGYSENYKETTEPYIYSNTTIVQMSPGATEKVFCSLYGGTVADLDGYTWTIEDDSVASITPMGQFCMITAKNSGYARIKITHNKATYPYYIGIYVFADVTKLTYITTNNNVLTMKTGEESQTISVSLVNGSYNLNEYKWEILSDKKETEEEEEEEEEITVPITCEFNGNKAVITPKQSGSCTLRVTHPEAKYPLDILCRVVSIVKNVYIEPDKTLVTLTGDNEESVTATLKNISSGQYDIDSFDYELSDYDVAEITGWAGNQVLLKGKKNGSCKLIITHPDADYSRESLIIVNGQAVDSLDSSIYITTSQNYIRTKEEADETCITITLKGGTEGDQSDFTWSIKSTPKNESDEDVVSMTTTDGKVQYSRAASTDYVLGKAYITPKCEGTAVITITHEKALFPCEILVKVMNKDAVLDEPLYFTGSGILRILNGSTAEYSVSLRGKGKTAEDDNRIKWTCENENISISSSANTAVITAPSLGTGNTVSNLTISHNKAEADKKVLILTADTEEELKNMNALYSDKTNYNLNIGDTTYFMTNYVGFDTYENTTDEEGNEVSEKQSFDFSGAVWTCSNESVCSITQIESNPLNCKVTALKAGTAKVTVSVRDNDSKIYRCEYLVTVYPRDAVKLAPEVYFTTSNNVVNLRSKGSTAGVYISAVNLDYSEYENIKWECEDSSVCSVNDSGNYAKITAVSEGQTVIKVTHPESQNTLKIYVNVGKDFVISADSSAYIKSTNLITLKKGDKATLLSATLANYSGTDTSGFSFNSDDESVAKISAQSDNGTAYIKPLSVGYTEIKISHKLTDTTKKVLVIVEKDDEAINTALSKNIYLTTSKNVVDFSEPGQSQSVKINAVNLSEDKYQLITWTSSDESVVTVVPNGTSATLRSEGEGSAYVYATYSDSINTLRFNVYVGEAAISGNGNSSSNGNNNSGGNSSGNSGGSSGSSQSGNSSGNGSSENKSSAYISSVNVLQVLKTEESTKLTATLANYSGTDTSGFSFSIADTSKAIIDSQSDNGTAYVKYVESGYTEITISHKITSITKKVLVVTGETEEEIAQLLASMIYFTTTKNVVDFEKEGLKQIVNINAINLSETKYSEITWTSSDESVVTVVPNGTSATFRSEGEGSAFVYVTHEDSQNTLCFYIYVGEAAISGNGNSSGNTGTSTGNGGNGSSQSGNTNITGKSAYISSVNVLAVLKSEESTKLTATLANYSGTDTSGFSFTIADTSKARIAQQSENGTAYIKYVSSGYTEITISHTATDVTKKVLVITGETEEEIAQILAELKYLTTSNNTVFIDKPGNRTSVKVTARNISESSCENIKWVSTDPKIVEVIGNGTSAVFIGLKAGNTTVKCSHTDSQNDIVFYVYIGDEPEKINSTTQQIQPVVYIDTDKEIIKLVNGGQAETLKAVLVNYKGQDTSGFSFTIADTSKAEIVNQLSSGMVFVKPKAAGLTELTISNTKADIATRKIPVIVGNSEEELAKTTYLTTNTNVVSVGVGNTRTVSVSVRNTDDVIIDGYTWTPRDSSVVSVLSQGATAVFKGLKEGNTIVTVSNTSCNYSLDIIVQCVNTVTAAATPYVQLSSSILTLTVGNTYTSITADLVGGTEEDKKGFVWTVNNSASEICECYGQNEVGKIRAKKAGRAYITVSHSKATNRSATILVICENPTQKDCYISVPENIISMKPTDGTKTINANLINGTANDKYDFKWSLDNYDVLDFTYSANTCMITPKTAGEAEITITHPKAQSQTIVVKVQQYTNFAFPNDYITLTNGQVYFADMQVPYTNVTTYIEYQTNNKSVCTIGGSKNTAQITATGAGSAIVTAKLQYKKIVNSKETIETQASAEMMVYVKEAPVNTCYITATKTIQNLKKGSNTTLQVSITGSGIEADDLQKFRWDTNDTNLITIAGANTDENDDDKDGNKEDIYVYAQSVYITAIAGGEAVLTVTHPKAASSLQFLIIIPSEVEKSVMLNKNNIQLVKGGGGTTIQANIENYESNSDYNSLEWSVENADKSSTIEVCRITGFMKGDVITGKEINIYPVNIGAAKITVSLPNGSSATCNVTVEAGKSITLESTAISCQPGEKKKIKYKVSPPNANLTLTPNQAGDFFTYSSRVTNTVTGVGEIEITGMKVGRGNLYIVTDGNAKANLSVDISWDYIFTLTGRTSFNVTPGNTAEVNYRVSPKDAEIFADDEFIEDGYYKMEIVKTADKDGKPDGTGKLIFTGLKETGGTQTFKIKAKNPQDNDYIFKEQTVKGNVSYDFLHIKTEEVSTGKVGKWSKYIAGADDDNGTLIIGDGEKINLKFSIVEADAEAYIKSVTFDMTPGKTNLTLEKTGSSTSQPKNIQYSIKHPRDEIEYEYKILSYYEPCYYKGPFTQTVSNSGDMSGGTHEETINVPDSAFTVISDWKNSLYWMLESDDVAKYHNDYFGLLSQYSEKEINYNALTLNKIGDPDKFQWLVMYDDTPKKQEGRNYRRKKGTELVGKVYSVEEFRNIAWFYCPGTPNTSSKDMTTVYYPVENPGAYGTDKTVNVSAHEMTENVNYDYRPEITDCSAKNTDTIGQIVITIVRKTKKGNEEIQYSIPVTCETRYCECTYKPEE